jgi:hypothetical protein
VTDASERLGALDDDAFYALVGQIARDRWETVDVSPPSPEGNVDVVVGDRRLVTVCRLPDGDALGPLAVADLAAMRDRRDFAAATLVSTGGFSAAAREMARAARVDLAGPDDLLSWVRQAGADLPDAGHEPEREPSPVGMVRERYAADWPEELIERADAVLDAVGTIADAHPDVSEGNASTELRYGEPRIRVRFTETNFLVLVGRDGGNDSDDDFEPVVRLTAFREQLPPAEGLIESLRAAVGAEE